MKLLKTIIILVPIISIAVFNWYCQNESIQNTSMTNDSHQTDGSGTDGVRLTILEYAYITPPQGMGDPSYGFIGVPRGAISHEINPWGYTNSSFTTPYADRYDAGGYRYQTQYFIMSMEANNLNTCEPDNCAGRYKITGVTNDYIDHFYWNGDCTSCINGYKKCYWSADSTISLNENTTYYFSVGSDCIVGGEWGN